MSDQLTPMLRQYHELKRQHPGALLFFRLGDFYEMFYEDAVTGARELEITLTARHKETSAPVPMCGVPHHSVSAHIARLIRKGFRVAICEQTEEPGKGKKLVRREVVRVITPGTAIDPQLVETRESVYLASVCACGENFGAAFLDLSTGEFRATETDAANAQEAWAKIRADIESYAPRELLFPASLSALIKDAFGDDRARHAHAPATRPLPVSRQQQQETKDEIANRQSKIENSQTQDSAGVVARIAPENFSAHPSIALTPLDDWLFEPIACASLLLEQFGARSLDGYGLTKRIGATAAAGACLRYARETQRAAAAHVTDISFFAPQDHLVLDAVTIRNLELVEAQNCPPQTSGKRAASQTLLGVIDETVTGMGARLLRSWLLRPSVKRGEIEARLAAVDALHSSHITRDALRSRLSEVADLERLIARLNMNTAAPRDLCALRRSLERVPEIQETLSDANLNSSSLLQILRESLDALSDVKDLIARAISDDPPLNFSDGGAIRDGFSTELDELRSVSRDAKSVIAQIENRERARSGIASLRVRYTNVFGYFIEVSKANAARVPADYERRQTLANAERFTTPELKNWEAHALGAEERIAELESKIFAEVRAQIASETKRLQTTARALQMIDCLCALAECAVRRRFARPTLHDGDEIKIAGGRHPVVESLSDAPFVPNDIYLNNSTDRLLIITGPNMGGKSTILKQTAIICLLAQIGSFVPANAARLPVLDRIWTRVGASDDLSRGRSTFMVEMTETAEILRNATPRSLVLLDEIGRGTATFDGLSIAWAVAEYLHDSPANAAKTLFATHYHELTELAEKLPGAQNYQIKVAEREGEIIFLYRLERGRASKSYGIEVARLAGLPPQVLARAREVLERLERYELEVFAEDAEQTSSENGRATASDQRAIPDSSPKNDSSSESFESAQTLNRVARRAGRKRAAMQATLFESVNGSLLDELRDVKVESLTDDEARAILLDMQRRMI